MAEPTRAVGRRRPGGGWYALAAIVAVATVVVTGVLAFERVTGLIDQVEGFQRFSGRVEYVQVTKPGEYSVYHEHIGRGAPTGEIAITVAGPDGSPVPVRPSHIAYGWGQRQARAVAAFDAKAAGQYKISSSGDGHLAFGPSVPGGLLRGFGGPLLAAGVVLLACLVGSIAVARRRRAFWRRPAVPPGDRRPPPGSVATRTWLVAGIGVVAAAGLAAVALRGGDGGGFDAATDPVAAPSRTTTTRSCRSDAEYETVACGLTPEQLRDINLHYADRVAFTGDRSAADALAARARTALAPLASARPQPSLDQVQTALAPLAPYVQVSSNAVRMAGAAFAIGVDGGCVYGSVWQGAVEVRVGGYVNDGGCLASYGH
ncbi:MAG TPA: hypothetical protein VKB57_11820 [Acidimicrobiales bacterium]|nr:hypothetical protein [Acidimicrobiales bacterium]